MWVELRARHWIVWALMLVTMMCGYTQARASGYRSEIIINIPGFSLALYEDGILAGCYPIAVGHRFAPSLTGKTEIVNKVVNPTYYPPGWLEKSLEPVPPGPDNPVGTRWLGLGFPSYGIHGTNDPSSIGEAVSSGCIRMHNSDVEELAQRVRTGTPVTFVYETVVINEPSEGRWPSLTVYPDIYGQGTNTLDKVLAKLRSFGVTEKVHRGALQHVLAAADGREHQIPLTVEVSWDRTPLTEGVYLDGQVYVPIDSLKCIAREGDASNRLTQLQTSSLHVKWFGSTCYVPVEIAVNRFGGYVTRLGETVDIVPVEITINGIRSYLRPERRGTQLLVSFAQVADELGAMIRGKGSQLASAEQIAAMLGARAQWTPGVTEVRIDYPVVAIDGQQVGTGLISAGECWIPLDPVRPILPPVGVVIGRSATWVEIAGTLIPGWRRNGTTYVPVLKLLPHLRGWSSAWDPIGNLISLRRRY